MPQSSATAAFDRADGIDEGGDDIDGDGHDREESTRRDGDAVGDTSPTVLLLVQGPPRDMTRPAERDIWPFPLDTNEI